MADVRALLKAKRQEARITHPLATYSQSGQLRCSVCGTVVKHASAWEGHLGSKAHRTNVARLKQEERQREEQLLQVQKEDRTETAGGKRKSVDPPERAASKKPRVETTSKGFPEDFFSDPSKAPAASQSDEDDEDDPMDTNPPVQSANKPAPVDEEWERFQREVINAPDNETDQHEVYSRATVAVDAEMIDTTQGIPAEIVKASGDGEAPSEVVDESELKRRKEQDEKELIMDRLLEEERVQEEADMKVVQLKNRLDALKKRRELRKNQA